MPYVGMSSGIDMISVVRDIARDDEAAPRRRFDRWLIKRKSSQNCWAELSETTSLLFGNRGPEPAGTRYACQNAGDGKSIANSIAIAHKVAGFNASLSWNLTRSCYRRFHSSSNQKQKSHVSQHRNCRPAPLQKIRPAISIPYCPSPQFKNKPSQPYVPRFRETVSHHSISPSCSSIWRHHRNGWMSMICILARFQKGRPPGNRVNIVRPCLAQVPCGGGLGLSVDVVM